MWREQQATETPQEIYSVEQKDNMIGGKMMSEVVCPYCGTLFTEDMHLSGICFGCGKNLCEILQKIEQEQQTKLKQLAVQERLHREEETMQREKELLKKREMLRENFLATTGFNFEGYQIKKYIGVVHSEYVLGTGMFSELSAMINDVLGSNSSMMCGKLREAKLRAQDELIETSIKQEANALIGVDFDVSTIFNNLIMVSANATAVFIEPAI